MWKRPISDSLERSVALYEEAKKLTPGGVHSAIRYFLPNPIFIKSAKGSRLYDVDDNEYIDFHLAFGPVVLGHSHPKVTTAVREQLEKGAIYGFSNELEVKVASKIVSHVPSAEMVRFCNSGTEATYHAIRLARAFTKRRKLVKFEGPTMAGTISCRLARRHLRVKLVSVNRRIHVPTRRAFQISRRI